MKKSFWKSDWFAGHIISLVFLFANKSIFLPSLERKAYGSGVHPSAHETGDKSL